MNTLKRSPLFLAVAAAIASQGQPVLAQTDPAKEQKIIEEVVTIGSRSQKPRSVSDSPVPIDVISGDDFSAMGNTSDITDNLKAFVPSFTATPATGDGSAFIRPTSLRGMAPDQTLVMVNGKRRHRSALVQFFAPAAGNGAHGVDIGMIPGIALKSIEVLRDGAAAQYGSDAIAGVMNFVLKDASEGGQVVAQYGEFYDDGDNFKLAANGGIALGDSGFINLSLESTDNDALSRGIQRQDAQDLIDAGVQGVGADAPFGDEPFVQTWGRPEKKANLFYVNAGFDLSDTLKLYLHGNYADTEGTYRFFYRSPEHSSLSAFRDAGFTGLAAGYTPYLDGEQKDISLVTGLSGILSEVYFDFSVGFGRNELDYFLNNSTNPSETPDPVTGGPTQRNFDVGGYEQEEINFNADFSMALRDDLNLGFGAEWREETYTVNPGEPNSYLGAGSNGLPGFRPADSGEFDRDNAAIYADLEHDVTDKWLVQYALRYEDFSDFGGTTNGKVASRYNFNDRLTLRGGVSTGFHAPTPGQSNVRTTITTFDGVTGLQVDEGLIPATHPDALANGGAELKEEESVNFNVGFAFDFDDSTTLTLDVYRIEVDDRIYRTRDIQTASGQTISFYTNALDITYKGIDLVLTSAYDWSTETTTTITLAYNRNVINITGQDEVGGVNPVSDANVEDIENNYPENRVVLSTNTRFGSDWGLMIRANYWGDHYDERGEIGAETDPSAQIDSIIYIDLELSYDITQNFDVALGGSNIFDEYVDKIASPNANRRSVGLQYPRRTAANYEGGSWYLRGRYTF